MTRTARTTGSIAAGLVLFTGLALAQGSYPDKPITMIVPFPPGGVADTVARPVAEALARKLGFTVEPAPPEGSVVRVLRNLVPARRPPLRRRARAPKSR